MKVFLTSVYEYNEYDKPVLQQVKESADIDPYKIHKLVDDPGIADIIIFTELHPSDQYFFRVLKSAIYKKYKNKCYLYQDNDKLLSLLPTVSPSVEKSKFLPEFNNAFTYIHLPPNKYVKYSSSPLEKKYLYSFIGAFRTYHLREKLSHIKYERSYIRDSKTNSWDINGEERDQYFKIYAETNFQSKFILCPRGIGPSSLRIYECLKIGIPPVIISDEWIAPDGPNWEDFSIRIAEKDIDKIPRILEEREKDAAEMGELARKAWLNWFAKDKQFHQLAEACIKLHNSRDKITFSTYLRQYIRFFEPYHFKNLLRYYKNRL